MIVMCRTSAEVLVALAYGFLASAAKGVQDFLLTSIAIVHERPPFALSTKAWRSAGQNRTLESIRVARMRPDATRASSLRIEMFSQAAACLRDKRWLGAASTAVGQ